MPTMTGSAGKASFTGNAASGHPGNAPPGFWHRYGQRTTERLALAPGARTFDAGCGTGASAIATAEPRACLKGWTGYTGGPKDRPAGTWGWWGDRGRNQSETSSPACQETINDSGH